MNLDKFSCLCDPTSYKLYGVFDGHNDQSVAEYLQKHLLSKIASHSAFLFDPKTAIQEAFAETEKELLDMAALNFISERSGSTALVVAIIGESVTVANLGDSQAYGVRIGEEEAVPLNSLHNFGNSQELDNMINKGGLLIKRGKKYRLNGEMSLSRSFGDASYKANSNNRALLSSEP